MIKYSQGEIIVDLTGRGDIDGSQIDLTDIMKDYLQENTDGVSIKGLNFLRKKLYLKVAVNGMDAIIFMDHTNDDMSAILGQCIVGFYDGTIAIIEAKIYNDDGWVLVCAYREISL